MGERFHLPVPMWRVQFQLLGGVRRLVSVAVVCAALLIVGTFGFRRMLARETLQQVAGLVLHFLTAVQVLVVILGGCNALHRAMLRDYETQMVESHRLTPMSSTAVVLGYMFGATIQVSTLFTLFLCFGSGLSVIAGLPVDDWILGNVVLACAGISCWATVVFGGMRLEKPFSPAPVIVAVCALSVPIALVPGIALLLNVYTGMIAVQLLLGRGTVSFFSAAGPATISLLFTVFWINVAAVKYRRPDLPAINAIRGLVLLTLALLVATGGLLAVDKFAKTGMPGVNEPSLVAMQWISTVLGALVLASVITCGSLKCRAMISQGVAARDWSDRVSDRAVALIAVILICGIMGGVGHPIWRELLPAPEQGARVTALTIRAAAFTSLACLLAILTVRTVFGFFYARVSSAAVIVALVMITMWVVPPVADFIRSEFMRGPRDPGVYSWLFGCSPFGSIYGAWAEPNVNLLPGIVVQAAILVVLAYIARRWQPSARK